MPTQPGKQTLAWTGWMGLDTELEGPTIPEGLSPDCQDVAFTPGNVFTRPGLSAIFSEASFGTLGVTYCKSFVQPNGDPLNLFLTSDGTLRVQDVGQGIGLSTAFTVIPNIYASSVTLFGREYLAFHDGYQARDIPRSYDGTNWYRLTQDAPSPTAMSVADAGTTTVDIDTITPLPSVTISTAVNVDEVVTIVTDSAHGLAVNDEALVTGVSVFEYNGPITVATVPTPTSFTYNVNATGWANGTGGTVVPSKVTVITDTVHGLISGESIVISGNSDNNYNNSQGGAANPTVGIASNPVFNVYSYNDSNGGAFNYTFPGDGFNEPLPGPLGTFTFGGNQTFMINPNGPLAGNNLPGAPSFDNPPLFVMGVNSSGAWDGTSTQMFSQTFDFVLVGTTNLSFSAAGTYTFQTIHKEGVIIGMGGGITPVSGPVNNPQSQTKTAKQGLPIMYANNSSTEFAHVPIFNDQFTVSVPAPGTYPIEIDYCQWHHSDPCFVLMYQNAASPPAFVPIQPGVSYATPPNWNVLTVVNPTTFTFDAVYASGVGTGGIITVGGLSAPGTHQAVVMFQTATDSITAPSAPVSFVSAGNKRFTIENLPIGPPNVTARIVAFTGANGGNYFYIPQPAIDPSSGQTVSTSTVVNDNTSTSATFDFADTTLFSSIGIDITGNNLFAQVTLGPCAGVFSYSDRLMVFGDANKIQNLVCMGFEGGLLTTGATVPLGWDSSASVNGQLTTGDFGYGWKITGNGTSNMMGLLKQTAYQDSINDAILTPSTQYTFECYAYLSTGGGTGEITADFYSPTNGVLATASIPASSIGVGSSNASFVSETFNAQTPAVIPADTVLRVYATGLTTGQYVVIDELMIVYTDQPTVPGQIRVSYALNPEGFDGVTGLLTIPYPEAVMQCQ